MQSMHLAIDIRAACENDVTGKGQWTQGFLLEILRHNIPLVCYGNAPCPTWLPLAPHLEYISIPHSGLLWHYVVSKRLKSATPTIYVSPTSYIVPALLGKNVPFAIVVHDLIAFRNEPHERKARWIEKLTLHCAAKNARFIFTVSKSTEQDLLRRYPRLNPNKVRTIYAGHSFHNTQSQAAPEQKYILSVGTLCPRKNQLRLIEAFQRLPKNLRAQYELVLAGKRGWRDEAIVTQIKQSKNVRWLGYCSGQHLNELFAHCSLFAYPSLYEGFGLPVLDALQRGIPVLTSNRGSLKEIAGNAAYFVEPYSVESIARGLEQALTNAVLRQKLRKNGPKQAQTFSWERTVNLFIEAIASISTTR